MKSVYGPIKIILFALLLTGITIKSGFSEELLSNNTHRDFRVDIINHTEFSMRKTNVQIVHPLKGEVHGPSISPKGVTWVKGTVFQHWDSPPLLEVNYDVMDNDKKLGEVSIKIKITNPQRTISPIKCADDTLTFMPAPGVDKNTLKLKWKKVEGTKSLCQGKVDIE